jgi:tetratricopeptide (TPR) repeat protein
MLTAHCTAGIALIYDYVGDHKRSLTWATSALSYLPTTPAPAGDIRPSYVKTIVYKVRADADTADQNFPQALADMQAALLETKDNPQLIPWIKLGLANIYMHTEPASAIPLLNETIAGASGAYRLIALRLLGTIELSQNAASAQTIFSDLAKTASFQNDDYTLCWAQLGMAKASLKLGDSSLAYRNYSDAVASADRVRSWFHTEELRSSTFASLQDIFDEAIDFDMHNGHPAEAFEISEQSRARSLRDMMQDTTPSTVNEGHIAADVQNSLPPDTTLVSYYVLPHSLLIWKISHTGIDPLAADGPTGRDMSNGQAPSLLKARVVQFEVLAGLFPSPGNELGNRERAQEAPQIGQFLWRYLIEPLHLAPNTKLVIVPHRFLHFLPFAALGNTDFLIRDHQLSFAPSAAVWLQARSRVRAASNLLAFSNPDTGGTQNDLAYAEAEAAGIRRAFPSAVIPPRQSASRDLFIRAAPQYNILHFSAHGKFDSVQASASALLLAGWTPQDSVLTARDIYRVPLPQASLVTMSACNTALGPTSRGDEIYSLTSAFIAAGAKNVITTLWSVPDESTATLMALFYKNIASGMDYAEALRQAQLAMIADPKTSDSSLWAGFELVGAGGR